MILKKVRIKDFQSIQDSNEFEIGEVTCLVGKNESGKTALLKALYRLNPIISADASFDPVDDYPRHYMTNYLDAIIEDSGRHDIELEHPVVVHATYELDQSDIDAVAAVYGPGWLKGDPPTITLRKGYENVITVSNLKLAKDEIIKYLVDSADLSQMLKNRLNSQSVENMAEILHAQDEQTSSVTRLTESLEGISEAGLDELVYNILKDRIPKFLYFDEYYQLCGQDNLDALMDRLTSGSLRESDHPLLGLIELAGLDINQIRDPKRTETLIARLEVAENILTQRVLPYWSQNRHLRMKFGILPAQSDDPEGMQSGINIWTRVTDTARHVSTSLGTRSRGFVWFFSFLAWYSKVQKEEENLILLLDEPGLSLHAKAQADLLHYFEAELRPHHQLIYTTHSPFMVDPKRFDRVRIVQDLSIDKNPGELAEDEQGTRVITDVLDATSDSLFPLQGALGYDIYQTLFVGPNCVIVEGVSDLLYIQTISTILQESGRDGLSSDWTVTPVGGADKVPTFVALIGAQSNLMIAVLIDYQKSGKQKIENLYKRKLLERKNVLTYAEYVGCREADVEDMFGSEFYIRLVNGAFEAAIDHADLPPGHRVVCRLEQYLRDTPLPNGDRFNHYRPALYFSKNLSALVDELTDSVLDRFQRAFDALNKLL